MSPNSIHPPLTGATALPSDEGFARRRLKDLAGLSAIFSVALLVGLVTGLDTPVFAVVLLVAIGALSHGEQLLKAAEPRVSVRPHPLHGRHVRI